MAGAVTTWGPPGGPIVLALHGFLGAGSQWAPLAARWGAAGYRVLAPDLPGHGLAPAPEAETTLETLASRWLEATASWPVAAVAGYSLGGRLAMRLATHAAAWPSLKALVLVSADPGLPERAQGDRAERLDRDRAWAARFATNYPAALAAWERQPLFAGLARVTRAERAAWDAPRLKQDPQAIASALVRFSPALQDDHAPALARLALPTLWLAGEEDARYAEAAPRMASAMPHAEARIFPRCSHALPIEASEATAQAVLGWLSRHVPLSPGVHSPCPN